MFREDGLGLVTPGLGVQFTLFRGEACRVKSRASKLSTAAQL